MTDIMSINLEGRIEDIGDLRFLRAEWWTPGSKFVAIRYALGQDEEPLGLRLDLDKGAILDSVGDAAIDDKVRDRVAAITSLLAESKPRVEEQALTDRSAGPAISAY